MFHSASLLLQALPNFDDAFRLAKETSFSVHKSTRSLKTYSITANNGNEGVVEIKGHEGLQGCHLAQPSFDESGLKINRLYLKEVCETPKGRG